MAPATPVRLDTTALPTAKGTLTAVLMELVCCKVMSNHLDRRLIMQDTANCAVQYSLSVSLVRQTATFSSSITPLKNTLLAETPVFSSLPQVSSSVPVSARTSAPIPTTRSDTTITTPAPPQFTGGTGKVMGAGAAVLVGAMGFAGLL